MKFAKKVVYHVVVSDCLLFNIRDLNMLERRITYRRKSSYRTRSNNFRPVKTPGRLALAVRGFSKEWRALADINRHFRWKADPALAEKTH